MRIRAAVNHPNRPPVAQVDVSNANDYHSYMASILIYYGRSLLGAAALSAALLTAIFSPVNAADVPEFDLVIKDHFYKPSELSVPAETKFRLRVTNEDSTPEEFESTDLNRESIVLAKRTILVYVGPLHAGTYSFYGDFHRVTAQGRLIVK